jgi:EspG family
MQRAQAGAVTLSASTYEVAWEHARLGDMPIVVYVPPRGFEEWERAEVVRAAWEELERLGLIRYGQLTGELVDMLAVLAHARREVDARLALDRAGTPGANVRAMAAATGEDGVLAVLDDDKLSLRWIFGSGLAREIVDLLPAHRAGPGTSVSLPRAQIEPAAKRAGSSLYGFADELVELGIAGDQARGMVRMIEGTFRRGQFGAAVRDREGRRHPAKRSVAFHDTKAGRYLMVDRTAADGQVWTTVTPATPALLVEHVQSLLDGLRVG